MPRITVGTQTMNCPKGANLMKVLQASGLSIHSPCNGQGTCGKCKVRILNGSTEEERLRLSEEELEQGIRLACNVIVNEDLNVQLLEELVETEKSGKVLTQGFLPEFKKDEDLQGYGVAVDIGTTTVIAALIDLTTGRELGQAAIMNPQRSYGHDVLSRITYEIEQGAQGVVRLQETIVGGINDMLLNLIDTHHVSPETLTEITIAANCTMMHTLLGEDASSMGKYPYKPQFTEARSLLARDIGIRAGNNTRLYCLPQVSAFIGADIVAGAYVCGLQHQNNNVLFIDIGTNGEMVLAVGDKLYSCSCAAGPALEGMNISHGMMAAPGAIEDLQISPQGLKLVTIDNKPPMGLCGSGILAAVRELLGTGLLKASGVLLKPEELEAGDYRGKLLRVNGKKREVLLTRDYWKEYETTEDNTCASLKDDKSDIYVTQDDLRQVQLAKGALLSGVKALLKVAEIETKDLDQVIIAGQFGAHLPAESLTEVGIVPREVYDKLMYVGNSSKSGAYMALLSKTVRSEMESLAMRIQYIELADRTNYQDLFMECMKYPV